MGNGPDWHSHANLQLACWLLQPAAAAAAAVAAGVSTDSILVASSVACRSTVQQVSATDERESRLGRR